MQSDKPEDTPTTSTAIVQPAALRETPSSTRTQLPSTVYLWSERIQRKTPVGSIREFFDSPTGTLVNLELHATTLNVGEASHAAHRHPDEELVIVREGTLEVTINEKAQCAGPGSVIFYAPNDLHGMRNAGDGPVTYHVIRWISSAIEKPAE